MTGDADQRVVMVYHMLAKYHYSPRTLDDKLSEEIYDGLLKDLDPNHLYFSAEDLKGLSAHRESIDDEIKSGSITFLHDVTALYKRKLKSMDSLDAILLAAPFNYKAKEYFEYPGKICTTNAELLQRRRQYLKLKVLQRYQSQNPEDSTGQFEKLNTKEAALRDKIKNTQHSKCVKILEHPEGFPEYVCNSLCNAITACFDPHSDYMTPNAMEKFSSYVSTESKTFGLNLDENEKGDVYVSKLLPGAPAWKSGQVHNGDVIVSMKWGREAVDLSGAGEEEVGKMLDNIGNEKVEFTFRNSGGEQNVVTLKKEKVESDENAVKSFVLKGNKSIGYIDLPSFYTNWEESGGSNCANDVAKEILKLSQENINGLILDLRYNGGGSLQEAMELSGIFINEGVLGFERERGQKPLSLKDPNRGTMYNGPMVVLVNGLSASASELVAGALQDYNRAVIVGSRTYGKATSQQILPLDTSINFKIFKKSYSKSAGEKLGYIKVTEGMLFRATGKTNQCSGTVPDINLPDLYSEMKYKESESPNFLKPDSIKRAIYFHPEPALPVYSLNEKSKARTEHDKYFNSIESTAKLLGELKSNENQKIALKLDEYISDEKAYARKWKLSKTVMNDTTQTTYKASTLTSDAALLKNDSFKGQEYHDKLKEISSDVYIKEGYLILSDLINQ